MIKKLILTMMLGTTYLGAAELTIDKSRAITIYGDVGPDTVISGQHMLDLIEQNKKPIFIVIDSPGGSVEAGNIFIDVMNIAKLSGVQLNCVIPGQAASMAFTIAMACDNKYVTNKSKLLFHPVRRLFLFAALSAHELLEVAYELDSMDKALQVFLIKELGIDKSVMLKAFYEERLWDARELEKVIKQGWLTFVTKINNIPKPKTKKNGK